MKKHNILKVILCSIAVVALCTWIFPKIDFQYSLMEGERSQLGIFDVALYISQVLFPYFAYVLFYVLSVGIFYGVAHKIPAYRQILDKIVVGFKGKEKVFLAVVMALVAVIVSVTGLSLGMLFVFPFIISVVLLMGYNKLVAASVTVGSTAVGLLGVTLGSNATYYLNYFLGTDVFSEIVTKVILLVAGLVLLIYNVLLYASKTKNGIDKVVELVPDTKNEEVTEVKKVVKEEIKVEKKKTNSKKKTTTKKKEDTKEKDNKKESKTSKAKTTTKSTKKSTKTKAYDLWSKVDDQIVVKPTKRVNIWPFVVIFDLVLIILGISCFDWSGVANVDWFTKALSAVTDYKIADFPIFAKLLGNVNAFGSWSISLEMPVLIVVASGILAFIYGVKFDDFLDGVIEGVKKALKPAIYMFITYLVVIIALNNPFQLHFAKFLLGLSDGLNVITMTVVAMISSVFNIETTYVAQSTLPYVTSVITDSSLYPLLSVIFQSVYGLMMLVAPTSVILLGTLTYLDISYTQWLKHIWKLFLQLLLVLVVVFLILFLI